jgi:3-oxoacyl-[acyl-carrier protein] reductase
VIELRGARALVTGGSRGIGAATARLLARAGAQVVVGYRSRMSDATKVVDELRSHGARAEAFGADISTREGAESLVAETLRVFGGLDLFIGNAGIWPAEEVPLTEMDDERWMRTIRENVDSIFYTTRAVAGAMADHGRIVLVSSTAGQRGEAMHADYAATKGAVEALARTLAIELAPQGVRVNTIAPGFVRTPMLQPHLDANEGYEETLNGKTPLGRIGEPEEIAELAELLLSDRAAYVNGTTIVADGGWVAQ